MGCTVGVAVGGSGLISRVGSTLTSGKVAADATASDTIVAVVAAAAVVIVELSKSSTGLGKT